MFLSRILNVYVEKNWHANKPFLTEDHKRFFQMSFKYDISNNITSYLDTTASGVGSFQWCILE